MPVPFIDLSRQHRGLRAEIRKAVNRIFDTQRFVLGEEGRAFEAAVAQKTGARHAVGLASGSDALYLALVALGIGPGDEVITTPFTFFATAGAISRAGARPVFADIDARTFNLDPVSFAARVTRRTRAVIPVHLFGLTCDMTEIKKIAARRSLRVIEDAAQSFGARHRGRLSGAIGDAGCFSFYPTKNLGGAGDGGMLVTSSAALADKVRLLRDHGSRHKYRHQVVGLNSRLDEIQAAVLRIKLRRVDVWNRARQRHAADYNRALKGLPLALPVTPAGEGHVFHLYSVLSEARDALMAFLHKKGVGAGVYYPLPLHLQPCYRSLGHKKGDFPVSEDVARRILSLPMCAELTAAEKARVTGALRTFYKGRR